MKEARGQNPSSKSNQLHTHISENVFLTNPVAFSRSRKSQMEPEVVEQHQQLKQLTDKYEELMLICREVNVQAFTVQYREMGRKYKHLRIITESEIGKIESCCEIDLKYLKKTWKNAPKIEFARIDQSLSELEKEQQKILLISNGLARRVRHIEGEVG